MAAPIWEQQGARMGVPLHRPIVLRPATRLPSPPTRRGAHKGYRRMNPPQLPGHTLGVACCQDRLVAVPAPRLCA